MEKKEMLQEMARFYRKGNKAAFARMLGISPQTLNSWYSRNIFDAALIYSRCEGLSAEWLLTGEGEMLEKKDSVSVTQEVKRDNYGKMNIELGELSPNIAILKETINRLETTNNLLNIEKCKLEKRIEELICNNKELTCSNYRLIKIITDYAISHRNNSN